jgi:UDP-N-acetylmuramoyl-tripeptide--D-alanyl-D-alanine ligase
MTRSLASVAHEVRGRLNGPDATFDAVTTDTRSLTRGALFVAISGERFDGNDFIGDAHSKGAAGALVSRPAQLPLPQVQVPDTRRAFGVMARAWRRNFAIPVVAVTGSAGKTTVKELIAEILGVRRRVCVTRGNLNNDIGVPLTLMRLTAEDEALVIELGANHAGEIAYLGDLVEPTVGVITNASAAHLEGFGSLAQVAAAKGELLDHLPRAGTSVLNADDPFRADWQARARTEFVVTFGLGAGADCRVLGQPQFSATSSRFTTHLPDGATVEIELPLLGPTNVVNALAAAAAAQAVGASVDDIRLGLARAKPVRGRLNALAASAGATVIDDSYNANPASVRAALEYLGKLPGRRIVVLGDMAELGPDGEALHRQIGVYARPLCDDLLAIGALAPHAAEAYGATGRSFDDLDELTKAVRALLAPGVTVLVKGSRVMRLERVVAALVAPQDRGGASC